MRGLDENKGHLSSGRYGMTSARGRNGMFRRVLWAIYIFESSIVWSQKYVTEEKMYRGDIGLLAELAIPCQIRGAQKETFGVRLSLLDTGSSAPRTDLRLEHTHYGLDVGVSWGTRSELVGLGVGTVGYWAQRAQGVTIGLFSSAAVEMDGIQVGFITGFSLSPYKRSFLTRLRGAQLGFFNVADTSWIQLGAINRTINNGNVQVGLWNMCKAPESEVLIQLGLFNDVKSYRLKPTGGYLQIGILNRTSNGWWLPFSNFGL